VREPAVPCVDGKLIVNYGKRDSCSPGGIGHALARDFHRRGFRVFATARNRESLKDLEALEVETLELVVDKRESVSACYMEVEQRIGPRGLDFLINNA
jgi:1-acylglycerone phosphate reductase